MRRLLLRLIRLYRRHLSPRKGYRCAFRVHTGRASCSTLGMRAIRRYGSIRGIAVLRHRLHLCGVVHRRHHSAAYRVPIGQRGDCDPGCDLPCDARCDVPSIGKGSCDAGCNACDWPGNDNGKRNRRRKPAENRVRIPPPSAPVSNAA